MGLKDLADSAKSGSSSSSSGGSSSTSSSSSSGAYPKYRDRVPFAALYEDYEGNLVLEVPNVTICHQQIKTTEHSSWTYDKPTKDFHGRDGRTVSCWMEEQSFNFLLHKIETVLDLNPVELVNGDPHRFKQAAEKAAKHYKSDHEPNLHRDCGVCGEELHTVLDDYEDVNHRIVCSSHTIQEISEAGLL